MKKLGNHSVEWAGGHYAYVDGEPFSFAWEKNSPTMQDFLDALQNYLHYLQEESA